jgi:DNA-binding MarR family transcriptional regulator
MGCPGFSRDAFYELLLHRSDRHGRVIVNATRLSEELGCDRKSVGHMVDDLEVQGRLWRSRHKGTKGVVVQLLPSLGTMICPNRYWPVASR